MIGRRERQKQQLKRLAIGSTVAAAAGYVAGVLTAPKSGKQTRKDLKKAADKGVAEAEKDYQKIHNEIEKNIKQAQKTSTKATKTAQKEIKELIAKASEARDKAGGLFDAGRKNKPTDVELKRAMRDAGKALDHLRNYLKK